MMRHYLTVKEQYKDAIILYRLGDFYEMFFEDAVAASATLDLTLTGRDCGLEERAPMCGVPYHAVDQYIAKLIASGFNVAICEQLNTPQEAAGGMVERGVIRVITAGTVIEDSMLDGQRNNYLACAYIENGNYALAWCDVSTGEFNTAKFDNEKEMEDLLVSIEPAEIIANEKGVDIVNSFDSVKFCKIVKAKTYFEWSFSLSSAKKILLDSFKVATLQSFGVEDDKFLICACGALMQYLCDTQKRSLYHITKISNVTIKSFMCIDANTRRNLEIAETLRDKRKKGSLLSVIDNCHTNMGSRNMRRWVEQPLQDCIEINRRLDAVEELYNNIQLRAELADILPTIRDIERLVSKIAYGSLMPKDCLAIAKSMSVLPHLKDALSCCKSELLKECCNSIDTLPELTQTLESAISDDAPNVLKDGGYIKDGFNKELDNYRNARKNGKIWIAELEAREREATGIKTLKVGFNRVFGYYIEVSTLNKDKVPYRFVRKQTLSNGERYITDELKNFEETVLNAEENATKLEQRIFITIKEELARVIPILQKNALCVAVCDTLNSFALASAKNRYCRPNISNDIKHIYIKDGRHPVVEELLAKNQFVANDTLLDNESNRTLVITGPNMAGKSTYMRQVALITLMAHIGCFVPAVSAEIALTDRIFTRVGASDDLAFGQSTFMVEMVEVATILRNATPNSLVILDEIGRGTSTYDGLSIAWAVMEYVSQNIKARTLFSTHYHELAELEGILNGVKNYKVLVRETNDGIVFLRKIARGGANKSFGIEVASIAGVPEQVISRAKEIAEHLEQNTANQDNSKVMSAFLQNSKKTQMTFFAPSYANEIVESIKSTDVDNLTPLQALSMLGDLKEKIKRKEKSR